MPKTILLKIILPLLLANPAVRAELQTYKVERVVSSRSDSYGAKVHGLASPLAQIEIGSAERSGKRVGSPDRKKFRQMILVGSENVATKTMFYEFEKRCEFLCGNELQECHYTALIGWEGSNIGVPLVALTGLPGAVEDFVSYIDTPASADLPNLSIPVLPLAWPKDNYLGLSVEGKRSKFQIQFGKDSPDGFIQEGNQCRWYPYHETGLSRLSCNGAEALVYQKEPLLFSNADYNLPNAQLVNRFSINKQPYYTVMLGLKGYTAYGILFQEREKWRFIVKRADWATLC